MKQEGTFKYFVANVQKIIDNKERLGDRSFCIDRCDPATFSTTGDPLLSIRKQKCILFDYLIYVYQSMKIILKICWCKSRKNMRYPCIYSRSNNTHCCFMIGN